MSRPGLRIGLAVLFCSILLLAVAWLVCPRPSLYGGKTFSTAVFDAEGGLLRLTTAADGRYRLRTELDDIAPEAVAATLAYEDRQFHRHPGVNPLALLRAAWTTYIGGERRVGGSTLSMQLARLRFGIDSADIPGKLVQIARALQLERHYDKTALLEAYLNLAPYGGNVEGIGTAARVYYDKPASELTTLEALTLAVLPQNPNVRRPRAAGEPEALVDARQRLFAIWRRTHPEDADLASRAGMHLPVRSIPALPFRAPHFVDRVLTGTVAAGRVATTLDPSLQRLVERTVSDYLAARRVNGLDNAAVLVADTRDTSVAALVGSADWFDASIDGQVDGTNARRSPGSVLKPFIYALALEQGLIHPMTLMTDAPVRFGAYTPENFDRGFVGPITARDALVYSRNVPALKLTAKLTDPDFYGFLKNAGIGDMAPRGHYGLAIALGGIDVTMEEVVTLYAALANGGKQRSLKWREQPGGQRLVRRLLTPEASFVTLEMLARKQRPDPGRGGHPTYIPWKTGTSYAFRDAWSVGLIGPYAVAVWVGHFDGRSNSALVGYRAAAPLFFRLADALRARGIVPRDHRASPDQLEVKRVAVCAPTGDLPGRHCPRTVRTWFLPGISPIRVSRVYREVSIDPATGRRKCPGADGPSRERVYEFWPSRILALFRRAGLPRRTPPQFAPDCNLTATAAIGHAPRITHPQATVTYRSRPDPGQTIALRANADAGARKLYWFVDGAFVGAATTGEAVAWQPRPGRFRVRVVDDLGRADQIAVRIAALPDSGRTIADVRSPDSQTASSHRPRGTMQ